MLSLKPDFSTEASPTTPVNNGLPSSLLSPVLSIGCQ